VRPSDPRAPSPSFSPLASPAASPPPHPFSLCAAGNSTNPFDGGTPNPFSGNKYYSATANYSLHCGSASWSLPEAQQQGLDLGSTLHALPTVEELLGMMAAALAL